MTVRYFSRLIQSSTAAFLLLSTGCSSDPWSGATGNQEILWGIGNEIPMAQETSLFKEAPVRMITSWFSKPDDLEWMRYYPGRNTMTALYGQGYAQQLVIWLAGYPQYALSAEFQRDLKELTDIFRGRGPHYGPLYIVLFTEYETYSDDPEYFRQLGEAFMESKNTVQEAYDRAYVALGFGGYEWSGIEHREFEEWEIEALKAGDFIAVQAHHHVSNMHLMIPQIRSSVKQLGSYGKPVMLSHFRIWKREGEKGLSTDDAFQYFIGEMFSDRSIEALAEDGLFAWGFFLDDFVNKNGKAYFQIRAVVRRHASEKTDLLYFR